MSRSRLRWFLIAGVAIVALVAGRWFVSAPVQDASVASVRAKATPLVQALGSAPAANIPRPGPPQAPAPAAQSGEPAAPNSEEEMHPSLGDVDLEEVRKAIPDNVYWKFSAPTKDPQVLEERDAERDRWNVEYGKILSGTGTEEEIRAYYDQRARLSGDYIEFASYLLDHYKENLSEQDLTLLHLAMRLHHARLEEIPRKVEEAFARKRQQDAAREAWLADQANFGAADPDSN